MALAFVAIMFLIVYIVREGMSPFRRGRGVTPLRMLYAMRRELGRGLALRIAFVVTLLAMRAVLLMRVPGLPEATLVPIMGAHEVVVVTQVTLVQVDERLGWVCFPQPRPKLFAPLWFPTYASVSFPDAALAVKDPQGSFSGGLWLAYIGFLRRDERSEFDFRDT